MMSRGCSARRSRPTGPDSLRRRNSSMAGCWPSTRYHAASLHYLGVLALQTGRSRAALDLLARAVSLNDGACEPHYHLALALEGEGRLDNSAFHYERAIALKPDYAAAHLNLGNIRMRQGRDSDEAACYGRVLALEPRSAVAHYNIANVLARQSGFGEAETSYRAAIDRNPSASPRRTTISAMSSRTRIGSLRPRTPMHAPWRSSRPMSRRTTIWASPCRCVALRPRRRRIFARRCALRLALSRRTTISDLRCPARASRTTAHTAIRVAFALRPGDLDAIHHLARELLTLGDAVGSGGRVDAGARSRGACGNPRACSHCVCRSHAGGSSWSRYVPTWCAPCRRDGRAAASSSVSAFVWSSAADVPAAPRASRGCAVRSEPTARGSAICRPRRRPASASGDDLGTGQRRRAGAGADRRPPNAARGTPRASEQPDCLDFCCRPGATVLHQRIRFRRRPTRSAPR